MELGEQLKGEGKTQEMTDLIQKVRTILKFMSKAKAAKLVCVFPAMKEMIEIAVKIFKSHSNQFKRQKTQYFLVQVRGLVDMFLEMKINRDPADSGENEVQLCKVLCYIEFDGYC